MSETISNINNYSLWANIDTLNQIDKHCLLCISSFLSLFFDTHKKIKKDDLNAKLAVIPRYKKLVCLIYSTLIDKKFLNYHNGYLHLTDNFHTTVKQQTDTKSKIFKEYNGIFNLLSICFNNYREILQGKINAITLLFPNGRSEYLNDLLQNKTAKYSNDHTLLRQIAEFLNENKRITNILEVGAGDGIFTWPLLASLNNKPNCYVFSDIGRAFLIDAKCKAKQMNYEFMRFEAVNINKPIHSILSEQFDAIIAYNVIHASTNLDTTLTHLSQALKPNGYLIIIEIYQPYLWQHLVWGLLEGWWSFNDNYRTDNPTISVDKWRQAILNNNLKIIKLFPKKEQLKTNDTALIISQKICDTMIKEVK